MDSRQRTCEALLRDPAVCAALRAAWKDSRPGVTGGHEEGGFILQDPAGALTVVRSASGIYWIAPTGTVTDIDEGLAFLSGGK